jgi:probable HAF family extracellular repeat protein
MLRYLKNVRLWLAIAVATCLVCSSQALAKKPPKPPSDDSDAAYTIVPFLPPDFESVSSHVADFNETGQAVGLAEVDGTPAGDCAVHLDIATHEYSVLQGGSYASGVSNLDQIVGERLNGERRVALFWEAPDAAPVDLPLLSGDTQGFASAINDAGIIVGNSHNDDLSSGGGVVWRVFVDQDGNVFFVDGPLPLPPLDGDNEAWCSDVSELIDGSFQVAGHSRGDGPNEAVVWTLDINDDGTLALPSPPVSLGTLGLSAPSKSSSSAINILGDVCGTSDGMPYVAPAGQTAQSLPVPRKTQSGTAFDINNLGEIVGRLTILTKGGRHTLDYAYLWKDGDMIDLETQTDRDSGWDRLWSVNVINDDGIIAGIGRFDVEFRGFPLIPTEH